MLTNRNTFTSITKIERINVPGHDRGGSQVPINKRVSRRVFGARNYLFLSYTMVSSNDVQKLFLQAILSRKIVSQKLALKIWEKCVEAVTGS